MEDLLEIPVRDWGRTPVREEGRGIPLAVPPTVLDPPVRLAGLGTELAPPVRLAGLGMGLAFSDSSNMLSILEADLRPLALFPRRPRTVGRVSLIEGAWVGLEGECC